FEFVKIGEEYALDVLYSTIPADLLQTEIDTCWVNVAGVNPAEYIEKYSGRAPVVHLKDFKKSGEKLGKLYDLIGIDDEGAEQEEEDAFSFMPVGYGVQDMPAILASCENAGAQWVVVEQDSPAKDDTPMNSVKLSREYLKTLSW
ncbi:MAG: sugar phosphate isomerase/epimerase, partial [Clostridia bacterium]|nr:sugar phosphate isomerase/epimerase [Clostridia bacterium]